MRSGGLVRPTDCQLLAGTSRDWAYANRMVKATIQKLQAKWGIATTGVMDARTAAWFRGYGYTII